MSSALGKSLFKRLKKPSGYGARNVCTPSKRTLDEKKWEEYRKEKERDPTEEEEYAKFQATLEWLGENRGTKAAQEAEPLLKRDINAFFDKFGKQDDGGTKNKEIVEEEDEEEDLQLEEEEGISFVVWKEEEEEVTKKEK